MSDLEKRRKAPRWNPPTLIGIDLAVNNPGNGVFRGACCGIQIDAANSCLELEYWGRGRRFRYGPDHFCLSGKRWPLVRARYGVGNWCWDRVLMKIGDAADFLIWLRCRDLFDCTCGWAEIYDWFNDKADLPRDKLVALLTQAAASK